LQTWHGLFPARALDSQLEISKRTLASRQQSLKLTEFLESHGSNSGLDVSQSQQLVYTASETIPILSDKFSSKKICSASCLAKIPVPLPRSGPYGAARARVRSAGLPSELLERRPDVRQAEEIILAANAQIGVAKASFFPSISLTGTGGLESNALNRFINTPSQTWFGALSVSQPVFQGGALPIGTKA